jgi:hypothetical protein
MTDNITRFQPRVVARPKTDKPAPVESVVKKLKALLKEAEAGTLRAVGITGVDLIKNPDEHVSKYAIFVSYDYDTDDPYTLEHFLLAGHNIAHRRIMDNCVLPDLDTDVEIGGPDDPDPAS